MAEMTKKEFLLIEDAVNEGVEEFFKSLTTLKGNYPTYSETTETMLRKALAFALSKRLCYASNSFDEVKFRQAILKLNRAELYTRKNLATPGPASAT